MVAAQVWSLRPAGGNVPTRRYVRRTMVLKTVYTTASGTVTITEALALGKGNRGHDLGSGPPVRFCAMQGAPGDLWHWKSLSRRAPDTACFRRCSILHPQVWWEA